MKISKLFHWLYATLMFLPLVFFIPSVFYYGFNEHATNTETTTINYKYQSNEVNTLDDLVEGNIYYNEWLPIADDNYGSYQFSITIFHYEIEKQTIDTTDEIYEIPLEYTGTQLRLLANRTSGFDFAFYLAFYTSIDEDTYISYDLDSGVYFKNIIYQIENKNEFLTYLEPQLNQHYDYVELPKYTDYNVIESVSVNTDDTIPEKVNRAWNSIWDLPLFSWTKTSFVAAPFSYITSLFGVGSDNSINYVFAYFVSISICWLVFDLIMYVPNLAHRWLDRSSLE